MIGYLKGKIAAKDGLSVTVDVQGVGYRVSAPAALVLSAKIGEDMTLYVHTYVREDQISLYGFAAPEELRLFELLITVSGVGPKMAMAILSASTVDHIRGAIASGEAALFTKVSGVGRKTAERLIIELREKMGRGEYGPAGSMDSKELSDSLDALVALGYSQQEAREALKHAPKDLTDHGAIIRHALRVLGGR